MSNFITYEDGYYFLTKTGLTCLLVIGVILLLAVALIRTKSELKSTQSELKAEKKKRISTKQTVFSAAALALAFLLSYVKLFSMPYGGSVTLCSMLFVTLIGYWYGPVVGIMSALAYSLLQLFQDGGAWMLSPLQVMFDYVFAFAALGFSGFFAKSKNGLIKGYLVAVFFRALFNTLGGYFFWMDSMPEEFPQSIAFLYPVVYNYGFVIVEAIITVIILALPATKSAFKRVKDLATN
ncbi:MAG: energy-coupled thiamine transporter ThiT [Lachnospiraceae bacterium]